MNQGTVNSKVEVVISPPSLYLNDAKKTLRPDFAVAAQDCWTGPNGAFTGETSADMLKDMGVQWVIIGHSERRGKGETNEHVAQKAAYALSKGIKTICCIGEPLEVREASSYGQFLTAQLAAYANTIKDWSNVVIAYEPIWAIGTGKTASPAQVYNLLIE